MTLSERIKLFLSNNPNAPNHEVRSATGASNRSIRRAKQQIRNGGYPLRLIPRSEETSCKAAIMAGLQKRELPKKFRELVGHLVAEVEMALERKPAIPSLKSSSGKEAACLCISDIHAGKQYYDDQQRCIYNKDICSFKLAVLRQRVAKLLTHNIKQGTIDEFHLLLLGDLVDGSGIYVGQELSQDLSCVSDQISLVVAGIWELVREVNQLGYKVFIWGVRGNHGRQSKYAPADNNFDYLVFQMLYMLAHYELPGVQIRYASTTDYLNAVIKGKRVHLRHMAPPQTETAAARAKFGGWAGIHNFDILCFGHLHHPGGGSYLDKVCIMNGSPIGIDDLAERLAVRSRPSQALFGVDAEIGKTFQYEVYLDSFGSGGEAEELLRRYPMLRVY